MPRPERRAASIFAGPWPDAPFAVLPIAITALIGRETELAEISALLRDHRLVTITGTGGVGKTQTALHVANGLQRQGNDNILLVELAALTEASQVAVTIAASIGAQQVPNRSPLETLVGYLRHATLLLVLDNCEHLIDEAAFVVERLLQGVRSCVSSLPAASRCTSPVSARIACPRSKSLPPPRCSWTVPALPITPSSPATRTQC